MPHQSVLDDAGGVEGVHTRQRRDGLGVEVARWVERVLANNTYCHRLLKAVPPSTKNRPGDRSRYGLLLKNKPLMKIKRVRMRAYKRGGHARPAVTCAQA